MPDLRIQIPEADLRRAGLLAIAMIRARTQRGIDANGRPFAAYSTRPFARPLAGIPEKAKSALGDKLLVFTSAKSGKLWAVIEGGYAAYKAALRPNYGGTVNLTDTFSMLRALTIVKVDSATNTIQIGFTRDEEAIKALYHDQLGAGPRRIVRHFMGLTDDEGKRVAETASGGIVLL